MLWSKFFKVAVIKYRIKEQLVQSSVEYPQNVQTVRDLLGSGWFLSHPISVQTKNNLGISTSWQILFIWANLVLLSDGL